MFTLVLGPEDRICGYRYQEGSPIAAGSLKCWCGVFAIAECCECSSPLCADHIQRSSGRVYCATHTSMLRSAQERETQDRQIEDFLTKLQRYVADIRDPLERVLCTAASLARNSTVDSLGRQKGEEQWIKRLSSILGSAPLSPGGAFGIDIGTLELSISSPGGFASWAFAHPGAEHEKLAAKKWSRITRSYRTVVSADAIRITHDRQESDFDSRPRTIPGTLLLRNGVFSGSFPTPESLQSAKSGPPGPISGERLVQAVLALKIPVVNGFRL